eukprot:GHRR01029414.1.p1 GENE.GHRR01029414.1~~GHRR01029414.1.p1  ORF type:complete len:264 (+),score=83.76 GHRR01029414.1:1015-1806(+)
MHCIRLAGLGSRSQASAWQVKCTARTLYMRSVAAHAAHTEVAAGPSRDLTATIMKTAMEVALKNRLKKYQCVDTDVVCDARGLLEGRFGAVSIEGRDWVTPLNMTAHKLEVDIGTMQVDYGTLVWQQKVAMKNVPTGTVNIYLSGKDLGNFVTHPVFRQAAATAVHGQAFHWDKDSIQIQHNSNGGQILFTGTWAKTNKQYRSVMLPGIQQGSRKPQLRVGAQCISSSDGAESSSSHGSSGAGVALADQQGEQVSFYLLDRFL